MKFLIWKPSDAPNVDKIYVYDIVLAAKIMSKAINNRPYRIKLVIIGIVAAPRPTFELWVSSIYFEIKHISPKQSAADETGRPAPIL